MYISASGGILWVFPVEADIWALLLPCPLTPLLRDLLHITYCKCSGMWARITKVISNKESQPHILTFIKYPYGRVKENIVGKIKRTEVTMAMSLAAGSYARKWWSWVHPCLSNLWKFPLQRTQCLVQNKTSAQKAIVVNWISSHWNMTCF